MRDLYGAVLDDKKISGKLVDFFEELKAREAAYFENGLWKIDPSKLKDS